MLNYGIMSTSSIAPRFIAALKETGAGNAVAVSSRTLDRARKKAADWGIERAYGSHAELLADGDINIVYISTVNSEHYTLAKAALLAGKHVVCEKPCTLTAKETDELFELAGKKGLFIIEAQKMLFLPTLTEVKRLISEGVIGEVSMAETSHSFPGSYNAWMYDKELGGGPLLSSGIYAFELLLWLFGDIECAQIFKSEMPNGVEWQYTVAGKTKSGVIFNVKNSTVSVLDNTARIFGSKGYIEIPSYWKARGATLHLEGKPCEEISFPCKNEMVYEVLHIRECLEKGLLTSPVVTRELSLKGIEVIERLCK
ncbi:MAG: Gfo/Idh/MocA family oxidoreductase [Clostridia bacterium]|nr:Gfo/Idh/MocA family oxidoreductase [Clostridia bacterium]